MLSLFNDWLGSWWMNLQDKIPYNSAIEIEVLRTKCAFAYRCSTAPYRISGIGSRQMLIQSLWTGDAFDLEQMTWDDDR